MANNLKREKQIAVVSSLVEGCSIRSAERLTGVHRDTIMRLMLRVGTGCKRVLDFNLRNLNCERIQLDEAWCYVAKKQRHVLPTDDPSRVGDFWCFLAIDADTKLVRSYRVGKRDRATTLAFVKDLRSRLAGRVQLSSDAFD